MINIAAYVDSEYHAVCETHARKIDPFCLLGDESPPSWWDDYGVPCTHFAANTNTDEPCWYCLREALHVT